MKVAYLTGCFVLAMITTCSIVYGQNTCPTPGIPSNPSPSDGATNVSANPTLSWSPCSNSDSYNIYFGTSSNPPYLGNTTNVNYPLNNLVSNTTYYWRIVAMNNCGNFTTGPVWSFTTVCLSLTTPSSPTPQNGIVIVATTLSLGWTSSYSDSYDVYFGTSSNPPFLGNTLNPNYSVSGLTPNTTYFWRVVALSNCGYPASGPVWSFTTAPTNPYFSSNWINIEPPDVSSNWSLNSVHFTSSNEGWAVGEDSANSRGVLLHYLNGTWTSINPPDFSPSWGLSSVYFTSPDEGWAVGTEYINPISRGVLLHYLNGSWTNETPPGLGSNWGLNAVHFASSADGWAVGVDNQNNRGVLLHYSNGSWEAINPSDFPNSWGLNSVHFTSPDEGWAVGVAAYSGGGSQNLFLHYLNGSWTSLESVSGALGAALKILDYYADHLNSVYFISPNEGWAAGVRQHYIGAVAFGSWELFHYLDGSWGGGDTESLLTAYSELNGIHFPSPNIGWAVGTGVLLQYWYGDWEKVSPPNVSFSWELRSVHFTSPNEGWAVGTDHGTGQENNKGVLLRFSSPSEIILQSPFNNTRLRACSLYSLPTFSWTAGETFRSYEIQFSPDQSFSSTPVKVRVSGTATQITIALNTWKRVLSLSGISGGSIYWKVVGTRTTRTTAKSEMFSIIVDPTQPVGDPTISPTSRTSLPTLSWRNNCNTKFKVWFGSDEQFTKKTAFAFNIKNPNDNGGIFTKLLTLDQWRAIRRVVKDTSGSTIYWYVESWDGLNRYTKTDVMNFVLSD